MPSPSPLSTPDAWNLVAPGYATDIAPVFAHYAEEALRLAQVARGAHVLDVATGPGTLAFAAARMGLRVTAIDFAPRMIDEFRRKSAGDAALSSIDCVVGDGAALPFADGSFRAAFSLFGLMFFPNRDRGFQELHRVLQPGGRGVVSSWVPMDRTPLLAELFDALRTLLPGLPIGGGAGQAPLASATEFRREMTAGGFHDVDIVEVPQTMVAPSLALLWESMRRSNAAVALLERDLPAEQWAALESGLLARLAARFGTGPQRVTMLANMGVGQR